MSTRPPKILHISAHNLAIACIALSGAVHLFIVPVQLSHSVPHGSFFAFLGVAQLLWALYFRWRPSTPLYWTGVSLSGGIVITWFLAFFLSTPYSAHVEPIDAALIASKFLELIGLLALIAYGAGRGVATTARSSTYRLVANSLVVSVILGAMVWGGGGLAELIIPGSEATNAQESDRSHSDSHSLDPEGAESPHTESGTVKPTADSQITPGLRGIASAEANAVSVDLRMSNTSAVSGGESTKDSPAAAESNLVVDSAKAPSPGLPADIQAMIAAAVEAGLNPDLSPTPSPGLPLDVQAMIAVAVEAAFSPEISPAPSPGLPSDIQAMIAVAVEAELNPDLALIPTPGQSPRDQSPSTASVAAKLVDQESDHLHDVGPNGRPAEESVPIPLAVRTEPATRFPPPQTMGLATVQEPIVATSGRTGLIASLWPGEKPLDLKMVLFGSALVALTIVAMIGAVRSWNYIA